MTLILYPNQRRVTVHKPRRGKAFARVEPKACLKAMSTLRYSTFMLYLYLCLNREDYQISLSAEILRQHLGMSRNTYHRAFQELEAYGYLAVQDGEKHLYDFYDEPLKLDKKSSKRETPPPQKGDAPTPDWAQRTIKTENTQKTPPAAQPEGFPAEDVTEAAAAEIFVDI